MWPRFQGGRRGLRVPGAPRLLGPHSPRSGRGAPWGFRKPAQNGLNTDGQRDRAAGTGRTERKRKSAEGENGVTPEGARGRAGPAQGGGGGRGGPLSGPRSGHAAATRDEHRLSSKGFADRELAHVKSAILARAVPGSPAVPRPPLPGFTAFLSPGRKRRPQGPPAGLPSPAPETTRPRSGCRPAGFPAPGVSAQTETCPAAS